LSKIDGCYAQTSTGITVRCIRVPANGSPLRLVDLPTTYIRDEDREDSFLYHIPDFRPYWNNGWQYRDFSRFSLDSDSYYYIFYSFHDFQVKLPANKYFSGGVSGDAFIVKIADWEPVIDEWAAYEDVPDQMLGSKELDALFREVA